MLHADTQDPGQIYGLNPTRLVPQTQAQAVVTYLLRATFNAADQGFVNAQVLDTLGEGITDGQLTIVEVDGTLAIVSNKCEFTAQSTPAWGDQGFYSQLVTRVLGRGLLYKPISTDSGSVPTFAAGWKTIESVVQSAGEVRFSVFINYLSHIYIGADRDGFLIVLDVDTENTAYDVALILGGYDTNGVPYRTGESAASYKFGVSYFIKGGSFSTWTLIWRDDRIDSDMYATFGTVGGKGTIDDFRVPDKDLSAVLEPVALSTFAASNGTSLDTITPEVGTGWTEQSGDWDIQSNKANPDGAAIATVASGEADAAVDCTVNGGTSDNPAIVLRLSDTSNLWYLQADKANNQLELHEVNATVDTVRASAAATINDSTDYDLRAIADAQVIDGYLDGGNRISYASASLNETVENHGIRAETSLGQFDNFAVFPRTSATYDTELNAV